MNGLRSHIKNSKESFIRYPNTSKSVKKTRLRLVFSAHFSGFGYPDETLFLVFDILLGRLSVKLQITMNILKFWIHLENQPPDSIAKLCLNISDKMAQENKSGLINKMNLYVHNSILMRNQLTLKTFLLSYQKLKIIYQYILKNTKF